MKSLANQHSLAKLSQTLNTSRAGFYREKTSGSRQAQNALLTAEIHRVFHDHKQCYGSPRIALQFKAQKIACSENRVARLMRKAQLKAITPKKKRPRTTDSSHEGPIAPNLLKGMVIDKPNQAWAMDITYIHCGKTWVYLAAVLDLFLHKIVGWEVTDHMHSQLVEEALRKAHHRQGNPSGVLVHSDRGSQYASESFVALTTDLGYTRSMSAKGNCYDNATMESFFGVLKREEMDRYPFEDLESVRHQAFDYIEAYYNRKRIHTTLGIPPALFEEQQQKKTPSAEFSQALEAPMVQEKQAGEKTPRLRPTVATSEYPSESCSPAELSSVFSDKESVGKKNLEINNKNHQPKIH